MKHKCINIDWLEVYCLEPILEPITPEYFEDRGYKVSVRAYGTPNYRQMFTVWDNNFPFIEVRRDPYSLKEEGGIFERGSCHIRLTNRACYRVSPVNDLRNFIIAHNLTFRGITRLDLALDFLLFDNGMRPENLIRKIFHGDVAKINQCNIAAHGKDCWDGQTWNSLKWGSESSAVTTKLYNKTMELKTHASKFYIIDHWEQAQMAKQGVVRGKDGQLHTKIVPFDVDCSLCPPDVETPEAVVWRIEFSLKTEARSWLRTDTGEIFELRLPNIDTRAKQLFLWRSLCVHYFHFKKKEITRDGKPQRKDRCPDVQLSRATILEEAFKVTRTITQPDPTRTEKILLKKLQRIAELEENVTEQEKKAALQIINYFERTRADNALAPLAAKLEDDLRQLAELRAVHFELDPIFDEPTSDLYNYPSTIFFEEELNPTGEHSDTSTP